jgi:ubiquinone/menaquinone biosynthesis C-methylase UbiE
MLDFFIKRRARRVIRCSTQKRKGVDETANLVADKLQSLTGSVLEVGAGAGNVLAYLPGSIRYVALEPNPYLKESILAKAQEFSVKNAEVICAPAENIPFPDETFDAVVSVRALCAPKDLPTSLREIRRVLKKGGVLIFAEHVAAPTWSLMYLAQLCIKPFFPCDPARDTGKIIRGAGFETIELHEFTADASKFFLRPRIYGYARK